MQVTRGGGSAEFDHRVQRCPSTYKSTVADPPNCLRAAHVPTAFPAADVVTKLPDNVNRFIGRTYYIGTSGDVPYVAASAATASSPSTRREHNS